MREPVPGDAIALLVLLAERVRAGTLRRIARVSASALHWQPDPDANSIAVTIWHSSRWLDLLGTIVPGSGPGQGEDQQLWFADGWSARTHYDPRGLGQGGLGTLTGYTTEQMRAVPRFTLDDLAAYHTASADRFTAMLRAQTAATLALDLTIRGSTQSRFALILSVVLGCTRHLGEIDALLALEARAAARI